MNIKDLIPVFEKHDYQYSFSPADAEGSQVDQLFVFLGEAEEDNPMMLEMLFVPGCVDPAILQFFILLERDFEEPAINDLCRLLIRMNNELPIAGLGLVEDKAILFFRNLYTVFTDSITDELVLHMVHTIKHSIKSFIPIIKEVANGKKSYEEVIPDFEKEILRIRES